jgi:glycosyltransferase involved in cell wall biosynthesis
MRALIFSPREGKNLKMAVRAAKLHEYLKKNGMATIKLLGFNFRKISFYMALNYLKFIFYLLTKKRDDLVLLENEREVHLLIFFKRLGYRIALDIRDNRALQRSAYRLDNTAEKIDHIQDTLLHNIQLSDYVFTVSQSCKELYPPQYHKKIHIIENASDPQLFTFSELPCDFRVGFIAGMAPGRGIELLIEAMKLVKEKIPAATLAIAGNPAMDYKEGIEFYVELKKRFELNWISFLDDIYYSINANLFFKGCYLTVIPHPNHIYYHTTLPVKLFDSLACGRPIVATNCRETAKILRRHKCGLVADFSADALAEKISRLLLDRNLAAQMGANGRKIVEKIYNWNNMAKKIVAVVGNGGV